MMDYITFAAYALIVMIRELSTLSDVAAERYRFSMDLHHSPVIANFMGSCTIAFLLWSLPVAQAQSTLTISTPATLVQCRPVLLQWSGGQGPYFLDVLPGGQPASTSLEIIASGIIDTSYSWTMDITGGTSIMVRVMDSIGNLAYTSSVTTQNSDDFTCQGNAGTRTRAGTTTGATGTAFTTPLQTTTFPGPLTTFATGGLTTTPVLTTGFGTQELTTTAGFPTTGSSGTIAGGALPSDPVVPKAQKKSNTSAIAGGVAGGVVALIILGVAFVWYKKSPGSSKYRGRIPGRYPNEVGPDLTKEIE